MDVTPIQFRFQLLAHLNHMPHRDLCPHPSMEEEQCKISLFLHEEGMASCFYESKQLVARTYVQRGQITNKK